MLIVWYPFFSEPPENRMILTKKIILYLNLPYLPHDTAAALQRHTLCPGPVQSAGTGAEFHLFVPMTARGRRHRLQRQTRTDFATKKNIPASSLFFSGALVILAILTFPDGRWRIIWRCSRSR